MLHRSNETLRWDPSLKEMDRGSVPILVELRQLEHFVAVAEERHFTRAAERVHIVQSGLSASIQALERELGTSLLRRSTRRVDLTEAGRALLPEARRTLAAAREARDAVAAVEGLLRGTLEVGIMQSLEVIGLPELLGRYRTEHPGVDIRLRQAGSATLAGWVREGALELAFASLPEHALEGLDRRVLFTEPMALACAPGHRLAGRGSVSVGGLRDEPFVEFEPDWGVRIAADRLFAAAGVQRRIAFEVNDVPTLGQLVAHGLGVAIVPPSILEGARGLRFVPLRGRAPRWRIAVVTSPARPLGAPARALLEMVGAPG
jgi:DNA-binding transcriptional LysR family regulator